MLNSKLLEVTRDSLIENARRGNFIRICPSKTCDLYDQYFTQSKPLHKMLYRCLFTDEIMPFPHGYPTINNPKENTKATSSQPKDSNGSSGLNLSLQPIGGSDETRNVTN